MLTRHRGESVGAQLGFLGAPSQSSGGDRAEPLFARVLFEVRTETVFGEIVYIVGSTPQLGAWNPKRGIRMTTNEDTYPIWRCEPLLLNEGGEDPPTLLATAQVMGYTRYVSLAGTLAIGYLSRPVIRIQLAMA